MTSEASELNGVEPIDAAPVEASEASDKPKRERRPPLSFAEKLAAIHAQKVAQLDKLRKRESAQASELEKTRLEREQAEREIQGVERAQREAV